MQLGTGPLELGVEQRSADREWEAVFQLASMQSGSLTFVAIYTMIVAVALSLYGSTAIVGFTSLRGVYIAPCFSTSTGATSTLNLGIFGGAIIFFANLLLICAVIFGEVRVSLRVRSTKKGCCSPQIILIPLRDFSLYIYRRSKTGKIIVKAIIETVRIGNLTKLNE